MKRSWIAIALLAGCVDRVEISPGICGNWVLEPGEDCDRPDGTCTADCRIRCDHATPVSCTAGFDGTCCPDGFACGADQACHAPGGAFAATEVTVPANLTAFRVGDLDGDRIADVIAYGPDAVRAFYGSPRTPLATAITRVAPPPTGPPAIGDYDGDGRLDVVWPVSAGLLAFSSATGTPESVPFPVAITPGVEHLRLASVFGNEIRLDHDPVGGSTQIFDDAGHQPHALCGHNLDPAKLLGRSIHPFDDGGDGQHVRIAFPYASESAGAPPVVCPDGLGISNAQLISAPPGVATARIGEAFYAALESTPCPALLSPIAEGDAQGFVVIPGTGVPGACEVDASKQRVELVGAPLAEIELATGEHAVVTSTGVFGLLVACGGMCEVFQATREWRYAVAADFDGDGLQDFAAASAGDDVEVFFQTPSGWDARRIAVGGAATELAVGDYDGDGHPDLAVVVVDELDLASAAIRFAFSDGRTFALAADATRISELADISTVQLYDPGLSPELDRADDLAVATGSAAGAVLIYVYGAADRNPRAPWLYLDENGVGTSVLALPGPYGADATAGIFGIFEPVVAPGAAFSLARIVPSEGSLVTRKHAFAVACMAGNFCPTDATFITVSEPDGAFAIGFAGANDLAGCGGFYLSPGTPQLGPLGCADAMGNPALRGVLFARALEVDAPEVVLRMSNDLALWSVSVQQETPVFSRLVDLDAVVGAAIGTATRCSDAIAIELGTRDSDGATYGAGPDLAIACRDGDHTGIFGMFAPAGALVGPLVVELFTIPGMPAIALGAGDVDGDGVEDLVYTTHDAGSAALRVRLQCDSHRSCGTP